MDRPSRRLFLNRAATLAASASTALSYARIRGANDRISLGHIGIGHRGSGLAWIASRLKDRHNVEMTAVCDLWTVNRDKAAAKSQQAYGRAPRAFQHMEDLLALHDVDAVVISTGDFQHAPILKLAAEAGKDAYCEKPSPTIWTMPRPRATPCSHANSSCRSERSIAASRTRLPPRGVIDRARWDR